MNYITKKCARETDHTGTAEGKIKEHSSNAYPFIDFNRPSNTVPQNTCMAIHVYRKLF